MGIRAPLYSILLQEIGLKGMKAPFLLGSPPPLIGARKHPPLGKALSLATAIFEQERTHHFFSLPSLPQHLWIPTISPFCDTLMSFSSHLFFFCSQPTKVPACQYLKNEVLNCYKQNPTQSLKCSQQVRAFINCVEQSQMVSIPSLSSFQ